MGLLDGLDRMASGGLLANLTDPSQMTDQERRQRRASLLMHLGGALSQGGFGALGEGYQNYQNSQLQQLMFLQQLKQQAAAMQAQKQLQTQAGQIFQPPTPQAPLPPPGAMQTPTPQAPPEAMMQGASMPGGAVPGGQGPMPDIQAPDVPMQAPPMPPTAPIASPRGFQPPPVAQSPQNRIDRLDQLAAQAAAMGLDKQAEAFTKIREQIQKSIPPPVTNEVTGNAIVGLGPDGKPIYYQQLKHGGMTPTNVTPGMTADEAARIQIEREKLTAAGDKAPSTAEQEAKVQQTLAKLAQNNLLPPGSESDGSVLMKAVSAAPSAIISPEEKANAIAYLNLKGTPGSQGENMMNRTMLLVNGMMNRTPQSVVDTSNGQLVTKTMADILANPNRFVDAAAYERVTNARARFDAFHFNVDNVKSKLDALGGINQGTRLALASALQNPDPSVMGAFLQGNAFKSLNDKQQGLVIALRQLHQDAANLSSVSGMGTGSDSVRRGIASVIPSAASPSPEYAKKQLDTLSESVKRLQAALPTIAGSGASMPSNIPAVATPATSADMVRAQIPGRPAGFIHRNQVAAFQKKYPGAVIGQ